MTVLQPSINNIQLDFYLSQMSSQTSSINKEYENICRICMQEVNPTDNNIVAPCSCTTFIHNECMNEWLTVKPDLDHCEVCLKPYKFKKIKKLDKNKCQKVLLIALAYLLFTIAFVGPYLGYMRYDILYPKGIQIEACIQETAKLPKCTSYDYVPLEECKCRTDTSTNDNTVCYNYKEPVQNCHNMPPHICNETYIDINTNINKCANPNDVKIKLQDIYGSLIWFKDIFVELSVFFTIILILEALMKKHGYDDNGDFRSNKIKILICIGIGYISSGIYKLVVPPSIHPTINDIYINLAIDKSVNFGIYTFALSRCVSFLIRSTTLKFVHYIISSILIVIGIEIICQCLGIFVTNVILNSSDFHYYGWKFPNVYNYSYGFMAFIIIIICVVLLCIILYIIYMVIMNIEKITKYVKEYILNICTCCYTSYARLEDVRNV